MLAKRLKERDLYENEIVISLYRLINVRFSIWVRRGNILRQKAL